MTSMSWRFLVTSEKFEEKPQRHQNSKNHEDN